MKNSEISCSSGEKILGFSIEPIQKLGYYEVLVKTLESSMVPEKLQKTSFFSPELHIFPVYFTGTT